MRKIILNLAVSLDDFIEGPKGEVDWCRMDSESASESGASSHFDQFLSPASKLSFMGESVMICGAIIGLTATRHYLKRNCGRKFTVKTNTFFHTT